MAKTPTSAGGVIAAFNESSGTGSNTGDFTWYTGDFATADEANDEPWTHADDCVGTTRGT